MRIGIHISPEQLPDCRARFEAYSGRQLLIDRAAACLPTFARLDPQVQDHHQLGAHDAGHHGAFLALLHMLSPADEIADALLNFLRWIPRQPALMWGNGLGLGQFLKGAVLAFDAVGAELREDEQRAVLDALVLNCIENPDPNALTNNYPTGTIPLRRYLEIPGAGFHCADAEVNNWDVVCGQGLLYTARAVDALCPDRRAAAAAWTAIAVRRLRRFLILCYSPQGEYCEGPGYYSYGNLAALIMLDLLEHWPAQADTCASLTTDGLVATPRWLRALYPARIVDGTFVFNDTQRSHAEAPAVLYWIARHARDPVAQHIGDVLRAFDAMPRHEDALAFAALWRDEAAPATDQTGPIEEDFGRYGSVVCRTGFGPDDTALLFRCGLHAGAHTHADRGNILFAASGDDFLVDAGMYSDRTQPIYEAYHTQAEAHNCVFPAGIGQYRPTNQQFGEGRIVSFRRTEQGAVFAGEYADTYPPAAGVSHCLRIVYWCRAGWFVVHDEVEHAGEGLRTLWHVDNRDRQTEVRPLQTGAVAVARPRGSLLIQSLSGEMAVTELGERYQEDDPAGARLLAFDTTAAVSTLLFLPSAGATIACERVAARCWQLHIDGARHDVDLTAACAGA
jgi:hypothetical protein